MIRIMRSVSLLALLVAHCHGLAIAETQLDTGEEDFMSDTMLAFPPFRIIYLLNGLTAQAFKKQILIICPLRVKLSPRAGRNISPVTGNFSTRPHPPVGAYWLSIMPLSLLVTWRFVTCRIILSMSCTSPGAHRRLWHLPGRSVHNHPSLYLAKHWQATPGLPT